MLEDFSDLEESAIAMHEWFMTLVSGGFTEDQALRLIAMSISNLGKDEDG